MNLSSFLRTTLFCSFLFISQYTLQAQTTIGIETGAIIASIYSSEPVYEVIGAEAQLPIGPVVGFRAGVVVEHSFEDFFALKTGTSFSLKGVTLDFNQPWRFSYITLPVIAVFSPVQPLKIGIGIEASALLNNSFGFRPDNKLALGIRSELAWQISSKFRLLLHGTVDMTDSIFINYTDDQGNRLVTSVYKNVTAGVSLAYTIHTFDNK